PATRVGDPAGAAVRRAGAVRRRVAETRAGPRLRAQLRPTRARRADGVARRADRVRRVPALPGTDPRPDDAADLPPLLHDPHGRPHAVPGRRADRRGRQPRRPAAPGRRVRSPLSPAGVAVPGSREGAGMTGPSDVAAPAACRSCLTRLLRGPQTWWRGL